MKKAKTLALAGALVGVMTIGGISAYFTDADSATNVFSVGKVEIDLEEPNWDPEDTPEDIVPNETFSKDPLILNTGNNDAYVFLEVSVPYATVKTANADGTVKARQKTQLFNYELNKGWVLVGNVLDSGNGTAEAGTYTYVYAYTGILNGNSKTDMLALQPNQSTPTLFDEITFINAVEDEGLEEKVYDVVVNAYGIQTENIVDVDGSVPSAVWAVVQNANPSKTK